jgi:uncharacterized protein YegL
MTRPNSTEIIFIVDRSGSMRTIADDMRGGFDTFIGEQRATPGECRVTLVQFDDHYEVVYTAKLLADVPPLELVPRGQTGLLDAIGRTLDATGARLAAMKEEDRPGKVLIVIITDGQENASREYRRARVFDIITTQRTKFAWEFLFLGANQDAIGAAKDLGIATDNAVNYVASAAGAQGLMRGLSHNVANYRTGKGEGIGNVQASYDAAMSDVAPKTPESEES